MARCLAVNTANMLMSLAVVEDDKTLYAWQSEEMRDQGNLLLQHTGAALKELGLDYAELDLLAVVTGPGSFTGIRIGLAAMRGLAMAARLPLAGVTSFDLCAAPPRAGHVNIVALESWRDELYFRAVDSAGAVAVPPVNETPGDFAARLKSLPEYPYILSGDGLAHLQPLLPSAGIWAEPATAATAARIALKTMKEQGVEGFTERPVPFYLREADVTVSSKK
jgi:tRNA threonylcarbamoyladenosine biosynthesis protein TsaB